MKPRLAILFCLLSISVFAANITKQDRAWWAFQPVRQPAVPKAGKGWAKNDIDPFIARKLAAQKLTPAKAADARTLIRRATYDLTGLLPSLAEIDAFLADDSPKAFEKVVNELLGSRQFGERWGRHWMDVARYADNKGYVFYLNREFGWSYTYRDYLIEAFNNDLPFDQFVMQQLAADQMQLGSGKRHLRAMGFITVGAYFTNNTHDIIDDRIDVVTRGLMGITVTCARCHDHKYDPFTQQDYYAL